MTAAVVTADADDEVREVARLMRDQNVGSVVICDPDGAPAAMITDRDNSPRIVASSGMAPSRSATTSRRPSSPPSP